VEVTPGFIEPMVRLMAGDATIGICQPKILSLEHRHMFEYAGAGGGFMDKYGYTFARGRILDEAEADKGQYDQDRELFWAGGACLMIRASLFRELKGFYDYYFMYAEEIDLCWRAQLSGQKTCYCHSSVVYHKETTRFIDQSPKRVYYVFRNNLVMLMRNLAAGDKITILPARVALNLVSSLVFLFKGHFFKSFLVTKSIFASFAWALFHKKASVSNRRSLKKMRTVYKKSILVDYYFRKKRHFSSLDQSKF
jgi:GT2 family glycosyltransferase